jgi:Dynamin family
VTDAPSVSTGYNSAKETSETVARILRDVSLLIGDQEERPVVLETGDELTPGLGFKEDAATLALRARDLDQGLFKIIVLGEFKNGKSTLLNGMLGSKTLPAKAAPATAIITVLVHGDNPGVAIFETGNPEPRVVSWDTYVQEFQLSRQDQETLLGHGVVDRFQHIEYAQIECRHPICEMGVKLIDSPGLGEHVSRTRVATDFLKQSHAVIFVLNATKILNQDEKTFIEQTLGGGRLPHVFFVVNRINQVDAESLAGIKDWVEAGLRSHFLDESGQLDSPLYQRRVFFVNARGALDARSAIPADEDCLAMSGVPELEQELERFLTSDEKVAAALASTIRLLDAVMAQAMKRIEQSKTALDQPLEELEQRRVEAEKRLLALASRKQEIERTILLFGEAIKYKVYADLRSYVEEMNHDWSEDSYRLINLDRAVNLKNILTSYADPDARGQMAAAIGEEVQSYLQVKFGDWSKRTPEVVRVDVETMLAEVEAQVQDFQLELDTIASLFAGNPPKRSAEHPGISPLLDIPLSLKTITGMTSDILDPGDWMSIVGRVAQQAVIVFVVGTLLTGGSFLIALILVEAVRFGLQEGEVKKRIRKSLGEKLHESLQKQVADKKPYIFDAIEQKFTEFAGTMTHAIQTQIDEQRSEQARVINQKKTTGFSVEQEKARLDLVGAKVGELCEKVRQA